MADNASPVVLDLDTLCVNTIRTLAADAVQKAQSGHPGMPMGAAPMAYALWTRFLRHNPRHPAWPDRDRFVLSAGHGSMLLYALLHLTGYEVSLDDIKAFRQWGSITPGHPEHGHTPGVETTTGPLGQGFGNGVGMALAEARLAAEFNRPGHSIIDHRTYVLASDGDIMEGVQSEAASLAGHLSLHKLTVLYDDNSITIDGSTDLSFSEDVGKRYEAYGWHVLAVEEGNDIDAIAAAIEDAEHETERPSLIRIHTNIGYGSPNRQDSSKSHGEPLGEEELRLTKENLGWPATDASFWVPAAVADHLGEAVPRGEVLEADWSARFEAYRAADPGAAAELERRLEGKLVPGWQAVLPTYARTDPALATRSASGKALNALASILPELIGGSADLAGSNNTDLAGTGDFQKGQYTNRNLRFGIREHAMGAMLNGMALHGGLMPYGGTFLIFSDYMRPSMRLAALMRQHVIYVFTHDSIGLGEDGPTHQPVEHLASLRAMPGLTLIRPADGNETSAAWRVAVQREGPTALVLTRQKLPILSSLHAGAASADNLERGAYVLADAGGGEPQIILLASGSEVHPALVAWQRLSADGVAARLVSMPSWELFEEQDVAYRDRVLPPGVARRLAVEAGTTFGWARYTGVAGEVIGLDRYGASAPGPVNMEKFGFSADHIEERARALLAG